MIETNYIFICADSPCSGTIPAWPSLPFSSCSWASASCPPSTAWTAATTALGASS